MITNCRTKTITEVEDDKITISCICSEKQEGIETPSIFHSDVLDKDVVVNKTPGIEGELLLTHTDSSNVIGEIDKDGNLLITLENDDVNKYFVKNENLMYDGQ